MNGAPNGPQPSNIRVLAVDWSGDARAARRRIRVAEAVPGRLLGVWGGVDRDGVGDLVAGLDPPCVVGLDFSFGLPAWFAREHGCDDVRAVWSLAAREGERWLAECPPPFWGRPGTHRPPEDPVRGPWRRTEREAAEAGLRPLSTFQVGGAGAVGTGSLRGMPVLARLRAAGVAVWPFDAAAGVTVVEIYPRLFTGPVVKSSATSRREAVVHDPRVPPDLVGAVAASEDAFDAALAALGMAEHTAELTSLPAAGPGSEEALEGALWRPRGQRTAASSDRPSPI